MNGQDPTLTQMLSDLNYPYVHSCVTAACNAACPGQHLMAQNPEAGDKGYYIAMLGVSRDKRGKGLATRMASYNLEVRDASL